MFLRTILLAAALMAVLSLAACTAAPTEEPTPRADSTVAPSTAVAEEATAAVAPVSPTTASGGEPTGAASTATRGTDASATAPAESTQDATAPTPEPATPEPATAQPSAEPAATATVQGASGRVKAPPSPAELDRLQVTLRPVAEGLQQPLFVTHAGDARRYIVEKVGQIRVLDDGGLSERPFLDITDRVRSSGSEQGLLGLAFPPDFDETRFFFINYTDQAGDTVIARYTAAGDPRVGDPASEFVVLQLDQPAPNHNGGMLAFGPDGMLWIGTGDGGAANDRFNNGQNAATLLGKMLRLDVTSDPAIPYTIPADNPFVRADWNGQEVADEIWGVGLRNPWRYSFDRVTGDLWIADVGQNKLEEVNFTPGGGPGGEAAPPQGGLNYGWSLMEGLECFREANCDREGLVLPVAQYEHGGNGCSITGGYVYRGDAYPALQGVYLYSDFCSGRLWGLVPDGKDGWYSRLLLETGMSVSSFGEDRAGELYLTDLQRGTVQQLQLAQ